MIQNPLATQQPACAHLTVLYFTMKDEGGTVGWWACKDCQTKFVPNGVLVHQQGLNAELDRQLGSARVFLRQLIARNNDRLDPDIWDNIYRSGLLDLYRPLNMVSN